MSEPESPRSESIRRYLREVGEIVSAESGEIDQEIVEIAARDRERSVEDEAALKEARERHSGSFYSDLVYTLANIRCSENEARIYWVNLLAHKWEMSELMGRNIGIRVAALDYFMNMLNMIGKVKIIESSAYVETAALAITDGLTGVFNHRYFQERLTRDVDRASDEGKSLCLLMFDIDHFKTYNDINGHVAGDVALREVARVLRDSVKKEDLVARYGGEEFVMILYGLEKAAAVGVAERVRAQVEAVDFPHEAVLPGGQLTVSCGVAEYTADGADRGALIRYADMAMYAAKKAGRNQVCSEVADRRGEPRFRREKLLDPNITLSIARLSDGPPAKSGAHQPVDWKSAELLDVSVSGLSFRVVSDGELDLEEGHIWQLRLRSESKGADVLAMGRVVWRQREGEGRVRAGLKFVTLTFEAREAIRQLLPGAEAKVEG